MWQPLMQRHYLHSFFLLSAIWMLGHPSVVQADATRQEFLQTYCYDCHSGDSAEAGLNLEGLANDLQEPETFEQWVKIVDRVAAGEMPPADSSSPSQQESNSFRTSLTQQLRAHQQQVYAREGRVRGRRLTNLQLEKTLQDLLGIDIPLATRMPDEPRTNVFTSIAAAQSMSHFQLESHLSVVDAALDEAFRRAFSDEDEWSRTFDARKVARQNPRRRCREPEMLDGKAVVWSSRLIFYGRLPVTTARQDGWYRLRIRASALNVPDKHGVWCTVRTGPCVSSAPLLAWAGAFEATSDPQEWTFEAWLPAGHMFEVRPGDQTLKMGRFSGGQVGAGEGTSQNLCGLATHDITLERFHRGPDNEQIRRWLVGDASFETDKRGRNPRLVSSSPRKDAADLMTRFAARAFRRPVTSEEIQPYIDLVYQDMKSGVPLLQALRGGYRAVLCSPRFLHFQEQPGRLDGYALASRLSYLVWNSMPDEELMQLAAADKLDDSAVLKQQLNRMLSTDRGKEFVKDFAAEWLDLDQIDFTEPDRRLYPGFDVIVQQAMLDETHAFLQKLIDENRSASELIRSDFTFLNSRLARYYDVSEVDGDELREVALRPEDHRGGLLTQGSILKVTANGTTTSPVIRGVWVSERILGVDIPAPPKNVPAIEPDIRGANTIREMLAKHKSSPDCASCHVKIDPPGFALENFDPSGRWRERYAAVSKGRRDRGPVVDAGFDLPDGRHFANLREFQELVSTNPSSLAANVVRQLLAYGTGATCGFADRDSVAQIVEQSKDSNFGVRSLLTAVVTSETFRTK